MELGISLKNLYRKTVNDEKVVELSDVNGITIIKKYPENSEYFKDGNKMLIQIYLKDGFIGGRVEMVKADRNGLYSVIESKKYKKKFTNFSFSQEENIKFDFEDKKILIKRSGRDTKMSLNEFVEILVENHLSDRLFWVRKKNFLKKILLKILFFLTDDRYDFVDYYHKINGIEENRFGKQKIEKKLKVNPEPFFRYFKIYKNTLFVLFVFLFFGLLLVQKYNLLPRAIFSTSNPILLCGFIIILFLCHYFSYFLYTKKRDKKGFIYRLHNSLLGGSFELKIKAPRKK